MRQNKKQQNKMMMMNKIIIIIIILIDGKKKYEKTRHRIKEGEMSRLVLSKFQCDDLNMGKI